MAKTKKDFYAVAKATGVEIVLDADAEERTWNAFVTPVMFSTARVARQIRAVKRREAQK